LQCIHDRKIRGRSFAGDVYVSALVHRDAAAGIAGSAEKVENSFVEPVVDLRDEHVEGEARRPGLVAENRSSWCAVM
jgi:hypothetical protein